MHPVVGSDQVVVQRQIEKKSANHHAENERGQSAHCFAPSCKRPIVVRGAFRTIGKTDPKIGLAPLPLLRRSQTSRSAVGKSDGLENACLTWEYPLPILKTCPARRVVQIGESLAFKEHFP
jgi:hypothetical protein